MSEPTHEILVFSALASSQGSDEPAHMHLQSINEILLKPSAFRDSTMVIFHETNYYDDHVLICLGQIYSYMVTK